MNANQTHTETDDRYETKSIPIFVQILAILPIPIMILWGRKNFIHTQTHTALYIDLQILEIHIDKGVRIQPICPPFHGLAPRFIFLPPGKASKKNVQNSLIFFQLNILPIYLPGLQIVGNL